MSSKSSKFQHLIDSIGHDPVTPVRQEAPSFVDGSLYSSVNDPPEDGKRPLSGFGFSLSTDEDDKDEGEAGEEKDVIHEGKYEEDGAPADHNMDTKEDGDGIEERKASSTRTSTPRSKSTHIHAGESSSASTRSTKKAVPKTNVILFDINRKLYSVPKPGDPIVAPCCPQCGIEIPTEQRLGTVQYQKMIRLAPVITLFEDNGYPTIEWRKNCVARARFWGHKCLYQFASEHYGPKLISHLDQNFIQLRIPAIHRKWNVPKMAMARYGVYGQGLQDIEWMTLNYRGAPDVYILQRSTGRDFDEFGVMQPVTVPFSPSTTAAHNSLTSAAAAIATSTLATVSVVPDNNTHASISMTGTTLPATTATTAATAMTTSASTTDTMTEAMDEILRVASPATFSIISAAAAQPVGRIPAAPHGGTMVTKPTVEGGVPSISMSHKPDVIIMRPSQSSQEIPGAVAGQGLHLYFKRAEQGRTVPARRPALLSSSASLPSTPPVE